MRARLILEQDRARLKSMARVAATECEPDLGFDEATFGETFDKVISAELTGFVVEQNHDLVGFTLSRIDGFYFASGISTSLDIIFVLPGWRGTRAPALLLRSFLEWSDSLGARRKYMGINNGLHPERTAQFFERAGARRLGVYMGV